MKLSEILSIYRQMGRTAYARGWMIQFVARMVDLSDTFDIMEMTNDELESVVCGEWWRP